MKEKTIVVSMPCNAELLASINTDVTDNVHILGFALFRQEFSFLQHLKV